VLIPIKNPLSWKAGDFSLLKALCPAHPAHNKKHEEENYRHKNHIHRLDLCLRRHFDLWLLSVSRILHFGPKLKFTRLKTKICSDFKQKINLSGPNPLMFQAGFFF